MGIDVSHFQGAVVWSKVKAAGHSFGFTKATDGTTNADPAFKANWSEMKAAGLVRGAYHFYRASLDPTAQAKHFLAVLNANGYEDGDLPPVLDLEDSKGAAAIGKTKLVANAKTWLSVVQTGVKRKPIIYIDPSFAAEYTNGEFGEYYLWLAQYGVNTPKIPAGWKSWNFWQYADNGTVDGIAGHVDLDHFSGSEADLAAFIAGSKV